MAHEVPKIIFCPRLSNFYLYVNVWFIRRKNYKLRCTHKCILFFVGKEKIPIGAILIRCKTISLPHTIRQFSPFQIVIKMQRKHERFINSFKLGKGSKPFILLKISFDYFLFCGTRLFKQNNYVSQITKQLHITARGHINGSNINLS